jgi:outer membrane protein assembly factor BamD (BamD/ComL family)
VQKRKSHLKIILKISVVIFIAVIFSDCAYFNMYYNAKESYNEAETKRKEKNQVDKSLYENSLKELSKILEFYPDSKWVDDALLMMGLCYLRQEDYYKAQRKFTELITNYTGSELIDQAKIHLAEVEIAQKNYAEAKELIDNIKTENLDIEPYELLKLNAQMNLSLGDSIKALDLMTQAFKSAEGEAEKISLMQLSAELSEKLYADSTAAEIYKELASLHTEREKVFSSTISYADALFRTGRTEEAIKILEEFTDNEIYADYSLKGDIRLAKMYLDNKIPLKTFKKLDEILRTNPKNKDNGALLSETAYYFGEYYFRLIKDLASAEDMYDSSGYYDRRNDFYQKAAARIGSIRDFRALRKKLENFQAESDSTVSRSERSDDLVRKDSLSQDRSKNSKRSSDSENKRLKNIKDAYISDKMKFAEKALYEFDLKDTAMVIFKELSEEVNYPHTASKAMLYMILSDSSKYGGLSDSLLKIYPGTKSANYIRIMKGIEPEEVIEDSAAYLFNISSQKFIDSLYMDAMNEYVDIGTRFPKSPLTPKILQAAGMIAENYIKDYKKAAEIYGILKEDHSGTPQAQFASKKLKKTTDVQEKSVQKEEKMTDSDIWYLMDRRNDG